MITTVLWDMGGIFRRYFTEAMVEIGTLRGWPLTSMPLGPTGPIPDPDYVAMANGDITEPRYLGIIRERLALADIEFDPVTDIAWDAQRRHRVWDVIHRIADSSLHRQGILTNDATRWLGEGWQRTWPDRHLFDAIVDVIDLPTRKPSREPFLAALDALACEAGEVIFIDDMPVNCAGAEAVGMQSVFFDITRPDRSMDELTRRLDLE